jgi:7-cyano-7-deazaguanine synthase
VPARNTVFLSLALAWAEAAGARDLFVGVNALDYSGYPDCRPDFIDAFEALANKATKAGVEGDGFTIHAPLLHMSKADIAREADRLGLDAGMSHSCYDPAPDGGACGLCDACRLRAKGFEEAGLTDPTRYAREKAAP